MEARDDLFEPGEPIKGMEARDDLFEPGEPIKGMEASDDLFVGNGEINSKSCCYFYVATHDKFNIFIQDIFQ